MFNYNSNPDFAERTVDEIKKNGGEAYTCPVNVQNREQVDAMMKKPQNSMVVSIYWSTMLHGSLIWT